MKGLLIKDLLNLKKLGKFYAALIVVYAVVGYANNNATFLCGFLAVIAGILPITALSLDERAKWDRFAAALPVRRSQAVLEKYLLGILCALVSFLVSVVAGIVGGGEGAVLTALVFLGVSLLIQALVLPVIYKLGTEKGRILMILILLAPTMALVALSDRLNLTGAAPGWLAPVVICLALVIYLGSLALSQRIYARKDL